MKAILNFFLFLIFVFLSVFSKSQTLVSGGIYTNTSWTLVNSPYIVTDTVVVFPNVTLTIEPGVEVRFDNGKFIEVRNSSIVALGTLTDSITFTSNSTSPVPGSWKQLYLHLGQNSSFDYCNFLFADRGIYNINYQAQTYIRHSRFEFNNIGLNSDSYVDPCIVDSCIFRNNGTGIDYNDYLDLSNSIISHNINGINLVDKSSINNCEIDSNSALGLFTYSQVEIHNNKFRNNGTALEIGTSNEPPNIVSLNIIENNNIGFKLHWYTDNIFCNKICNNTTYNVQNLVTLQNLSIANNYWCTTDSLVIAAGIYDGYDNLNLALVNFTPIDTVGCYLLNSISNINSQPFFFSIYPNPSSSIININSDKNGEIRIYDLVGKGVFHLFISKEKSIDISELMKGVYIIEFITDNSSVKKIIVKN